MLERKLSKYPEGKIHIVNSKNYLQYYLRTEASDRSGKYISKKDKKTIKTYLQKKYDTEVFQLLHKEKNNLENFLNKSNQVISSIQSIYSDRPNEIKNQINPIDISDEEYVKEWLSEPYEGKNVGTDLPTYRTTNGELVRSKSELQIANMLEKMGCPYKYECPFILSNGKTIYPDFTVLDIGRRRNIYWEHRGMMDNQEYAQHAVWRIKMLMKEGLRLGDDLIITEETMKSPLGTDEIEQIIESIKN